jgi:RHS repeat-associated protein
VIEEARYDAWGNLESGTLPLPRPFAFTGREWDLETGLYYYRARYYEPKLGRFISEDPIGPSGGLNFFAYADGSPTNLADPFGTAPTTPLPCPTPPSTPPTWPGKCAQQAPTRKPGGGLLDWLNRPLFPPKDAGGQQKRILEKNSPCPGKGLFTNVFPCNALYPGNAARKNEWEDWFNTACKDGGGAPTVMQFAAPLQGPVYVGYCCKNCENR